MSIDYLTFHRLFPVSNVQTMSDFNCLGFELNGTVSVNPAYCKRVTFVGGRYGINLTLPKEYNINKLYFMAVKIDNNATLLLEAAGKLKIDIKNADFLVIDILEGPIAVVGTESIDTESFFMREEPSLCLFLKEAGITWMRLKEGKYRLLVYIGAERGEASVSSGDLVIFNTELVSGYYEFLMEFEVPISREFTFHVKSSADVYIERWEHAKVIIVRRIGRDGGFVRIRYPSGKLSYAKEVIIPFYPYISRSREILGEGDTIFEDFNGPLIIMKTQTPHVFRIIVAGKVHLIKLKFDEKLSVNLNSRGIGDILIFISIIIVCFITAILLFIKPDWINKNKITYTLLCVTVFLVSLTAYSAYLGQPLWMQLSVGYISIIAALLSIMFRRK